MPNQDLSNKNQLKETLIQLIRSDEWIMNILNSVRGLNLPDWCIAGGAVRGMVWDRLHEFELKTLPSDIDLLYYDKSKQFSEIEIEQTLNKMIPNLIWEPVNQATIHGYTEEAPYPSTEFALSRWAETCNAVGVRLENSEDITIIAPHGLTDLFELIVRPNLQMPRARQVYSDRISTKGWLQKWPKIKILPLDEK